MRGTGEGLGAWASRVLLGVSTHAAGWKWDAGGTHPYR
ncbi:MAG: hypothetical protein RIS76_1663, partial [Verrucomicrobiota bacterium]